MARRSRVQRELQLIIRRYADKDGDGRPLRCLRASKLIYARLDLALLAADRMNGLSGNDRQFVYVCDGHFHLTRKPAEENNSSDRPDRLPKKVIKSPEYARRYRRKCGVAESLVEMAGSNISTGMIVQKLQWPLHLTKHNRNGRVVLNDILNSFERSGLIELSGDTISIVNLHGLNYLAKSVKLLGASSPDMEMEGD